jgi:hypothetical protein
VTGLNDLNYLKGQPCAKTATCTSSQVSIIRTNFAVADISLAAALVSAGLATYFVVTGSSAGPPKTTSAQLGLAPLPGGGGAATLGVQF